MRLHRCTLCPRILKRHLMFSRSMRGHAFNGLFTRTLCFLRLLPTRFCKQVNCLIGISFAQQGLVYNIGCMFYPRANTGQDRILKYLTKRRFKKKRNMRSTLGLFTGTLARPFCCSLCAQGVIILQGCGQTRYLPQLLARGSSAKTDSCNLQRVFITVMTVNGFAMVTTRVGMSMGGTVGIVFFRAMGGRTITLLLCTRGLTMDGAQGGSTLIAFPSGDLATIGYSFREGRVKLFGSSCVFVVGRFPFSHFSRGAALGCVWFRRHGVTRGRFLGAIWRDFLAMWFMGVLWRDMFARGPLGFYALVFGAQGSMYFCLFLNSFLAF